MSAILVTGGAGYIGSHVSWACIDAGREIVVLDNLSTGLRACVPKGARLVVGDVGDEALVRKLIAEHNISAIMHFAGSVIVPESVAHPIDYYVNNTANSVALLRAALNGGVRRMIFSSTAAVYAPLPDGLVTEDSALAPASPYGRSKLVFEQILADAAAAHDFSYVALRYFNVAGADPKGRTGQSTPKATHLIKVAAQTALGIRPEMVVFGNDYPTPDGACVRDFIHVSDLADAHLRALDYLEAGCPSQVFNCGYGVGISVWEVLSAVERVSGVQIPVRVGPRRPGDAYRVVADSRRLQQSLAWKPRHANLDVIVRGALEWERRSVQPALLKGRFPR